MTAANALLRVSSPPNLLGAILGVAVLVHLVFKKTETHEPWALLGLLIALPTALAVLYASHCCVGGSYAIAFCTALGLFWTALTCSILVYRISPIHPLAAYPGPLLCRLSKLRMAYIALSGKQYLYYQYLHEKYGDVVRVGPNELSIRDLNATASLHGLPKGTFWEGRVPENERVRPLIALRDKREHARRRRPWTRAFSPGALKSYEHILLKRCAQLVDVLGSQPQPSPVDLTRWVGYWSYDVMNDLVFGEGTEMMRDGDVDGLWHLLEGGQKNAIAMGHLPWLGALFLRLPHFAQELKAFRAHAKRCALRRMKQGSPHKDLFYYLIDEDGVEKHPPSVVEVINDGGLAIIAGADTTSSAITNLFCFLLQSPKAYKRLQTEIDSLGSGEEVADVSKQASLSYLNAALNECLRLLPPVLSGSQRAPEIGSGGAMVGSLFIPEGTNVFTPTYALHRDPRYFSPLPDTFLPERWLPPALRESLEPTIFHPSKPDFGTSSSSFILNTAAYNPFSLGTGSCIGKGFAWLEMRMVVCLLMHRYDIRLAEGYNLKQYMAGTRDYFVTIKAELPVVLTPRRHTH